jgi:hypothetical protein
MHDAPIHRPITRPHPTAHSRLWAVKSGTTTVAFNRQRARAGEWLVCARKSGTRGPAVRSSASSRLARGGLPLFVSGQAKHVGFPSTSARLQTCQRVCLSSSVLTFSQFAARGRSYPSLRSFSAPCYAKCKPCIPVVERCVATLAPLVCTTT